MNKNYDFNENSMFANCSDLYLQNVNLEAVNSNYAAIISELQNQCRYLAAANHSLIERLNEFQAAYYYSINRFNEIIGLINTEKSHSFDALLNENSTYGGNANE